MAEATVVKFCMQVYYSQRVDPMPQKGCDYGHLSHL